MDKENIEQILNSLGTEQIPADVHKIAVETSDSFTKTLTQTKRLKHHLLWEHIMKSAIAKLAVAAAIIVAAAIGIHQFNGSSVAWGRVAEKVSQIDTFMFSLSIRVADQRVEKATQQVNAKWTIYLSEQYGFRMDIYADDKVVSWFVPAGSDTIITVIPDEKKWIKMPLSENQLQQAQQKDKDPREYIKRFMSRPYKQLGRATMDGVAVEGIEVNNPPTDGEPLENAVGRLWVDVATQLPIRIEIEGTAAGNTVQYIMDFRWSQAVDPSVFEPNIPPDYTAAG